MSLSKNGRQPYSTPVHLGNPGIPCHVAVGYTGAVLVSGLRRSVCEGMQAPGYCCDLFEGFVDMATD